MPAPTRDYQIDIGGVLMGPGTPYVIGQVGGLGSPELRTQDIDLATDDGALPGVDYYRPRTVVIEAGIRTPGDASAAYDALGVLQRAVSNPAVRKQAGALEVLRLKWPGRPARRMYGRVRRLDVASTAQAIYGWIPFTLEITATDPGIYDDVQQAVVLPLDAGSGGGFKAPLVAPITTGVADPSSRPGWVVNAGDLGAYPVLRLQGPVTNPRVRVVETGRVLELAISLRDTDTVEIDTRAGARWVLLNGGNAAPALTAASRLDLFTIPPGRSEIRWTATDYTNSARLSVAWRDAYTAL